ncbi:MULTISPECIES: stage II sporulation protein M [Bacillus]|uniref:stage II sporulation protein M n=1 Tax=Bacillus TaxID=1386 RepID=UPI000BB75AA0|nr:MULTISPECIES: stage II sporulation protein M [Bacillus]
MNLNQFIKQHRNEWSLLENSINLISKNRRNSANDIDQFHRQYEKAAQHLSYSQTFFPNEDITRYLNELVSKAHNLLYKDQVSSFKQVREFFSTTFVRLLAEQWKFVFIAMVLLTLGGIGGFFAVWHDPLTAYTLLPANMIQSIEPSSLTDKEGTVEASLFSASIMTNNIQVAFIAFAGGVTFGLLTAYILIFNGVLVGAIAAIFWHAGMTYEFWAYIVPHGMIELTAIFIAGGAGLLMGYKLFVPGRYSRGYQLKVQAKRSVQLLIGTIPLFIIAGIIEGFITPAKLSFEAKYLVAFVTVIGLILYAVIGLHLNKRKNKWKPAEE